MNGELNRPASSPHLAQYQDRILDLLEGTLPSDQRRMIETHIESCAECRAFAETARTLDETLQISLVSPGLSEDFAARICRTIDEEDLDSAYEQRKRKMMSEFDKYSRSLRKQFFQPSHLLDLIGYISVVLLGSYLLLGFLTSGSNFPAWTDFITRHFLLVSSATGIIVAITGLFIAARQSRTV